LDSAGLKKMESYGVKATEIRVVGGGSKNRLWRRIIADSFQLPLRFPTEPESAALGAALQAAAVHAGVATPEFIDSHSPPLADLVSSIMETIMLGTLKGVLTLNA
jgi:xylulokinase